MLNPRAKPFEFYKKENPSFYIHHTFRSFHHTPPPPPPPFSYYHFLPSYRNHPPCRLYPFRPPTFISSPTNNAIPFMKHPTNPDAFEVMKKRSPTTFTPRAQKVYRQRSNKPYCGTTWMWRPKGAGNKNSEAAVVQHSSSSSSSPYDFNESEGKTTVMMKNIPNKMSKEMLLQYLDKHCVEENEKLKNQHHPSLPSSAYDFVYLPMDFRSGFNLGYAFVNFTNGAGAARFYGCYNKFKWGMSKCGKICEIKHARIQGKEELVKHFNRSNFICHTDEYLPTVFTPPRDGEAATVPSFVGRRRDAFISS